MTSIAPVPGFAFTYGSAFAILYVIALRLDLALFTVYPTIGVGFWARTIRATRSARRWELSTRDVLVRLDSRPRSERSY